MFCTRYWIFGEGAIHPFNILGGNPVIGTDNQTGILGHPVYKQWWEFIKENKKVRKHENTLSTKKMVKS